MILFNRDGTPMSVRHLRPVLADHAAPQEQMAGNATLRKDEWERVDDRVNMVLRERLTVVEDLRGRGLVEPASIGTIIRVTERLSDFDDAEVTFDGDTAPQKDKPDFNYDSIPVPVISKDFQIGWRQLDASRTRGEPLDVTGAELAARKVADQLQNLITNGLSSGGPSGGGIPGLTSAGNKLTSSYNGDHWDDASPQIVNDVVDMLSTAYASSLFGPFALYVPKNFWAPLQDDYSSSKGDRTFLERIQAFSDIEVVRPLDSLSNDNVVLVQMTRDVLDLTEAQAITTVQWQKNPMVTNFRVLFVGGPQIKNIATDQDSTIHGIVHLS